MKILISSCLIFICCWISHCSENNLRVSPIINAVSVAPTRRHYVTVVGPTPSITPNTFVTEISPHIEGTPYTPHSEQIITPSTESESLKSSYNSEITPITEPNIREPSEYKTQKPDFSPVKQSYPNKRVISSKIQPKKYSSSIKPSKSTTQLSKSNLKKAKKPKRVFSTTINGPINSRILTKEANKLLSKVEQAAKNDLSSLENPSHEDKKETAKTVAASRVIKNNMEKRKNTGSILSKPLEQLEKKVKKEEK